ncbi:MAG: hypothetical protein EXS35_14890 [Pedosphaera sp.]|nr:hypothetical protein [Pedosphaera sp.]
MHSALVLLGLWAAAFVSLGLGLILLNLYSNFIGYDFTLHSARKETILAAICSLIEAASVWVVVTHIPGAARALVIPGLLVGLIYMLAHLEDWNRFDAGIVFVFQFIVGGIGVALFTGNFSVAIGIVIVSGAVLGVIASIAKGM